MIFTNSQVVCDGNEAVCRPYSYRCPGSRGRSCRAARSWLHPSASVKGTSSSSISRSRCSPAHELECCSPSSGSLLRNRVSEAARCCCRDGLAWWRRVSCQLSVTCGEAGGGCDAWWVEGATVLPRVSRCSWVCAGYGGCGGCARGEAVCGGMTPLRPLRERCSAREAVDQFYY